MSDTTPTTTKICDYYLTKRGCAKGDRCDFLHEGGSVNPSVDLLTHEEESKICAFYITDRGCIKSDRCEFAHPNAPNGNVTSRICEYFQTPRGCVKNSRCDFLHVRAPKQKTAFPNAAAGGAPSLLDAAMRAQAHANQLAMAAGLAAPSAAYAMPPASYGAASAEPGQRPTVPTVGTQTGSTRACSFYQQPRGCAKAERCDFLHTGPSGGGAAPLLAQDPYAAAYQYPASAYGAPAAYGYYGADPAAASAYSMPPTSSAPASGKVCSFFGSPRGCRKGARCDFVHPADGAASTKSSVRYSPY